MTMTLAPAQREGSPQAARPRHSSEADSPRGGGQALSLVLSYNYSLQPQTTLSRAGFFLLLLLLLLLRSFYKRGSRSIEMILAVN